MTGAIDDTRDNRVTAKRLIDVIGGALLIVALLPVVVIGAVVVMVSLRTVSPFFLQTRMGFEGRTMRFPKLRTLPKSMPAYALKTEVAFDHLPLGVRMLRRTHVDELPQLLLVVLGAMSLVGPRPKMPDDVEPVDAVYGSTRVRVPQGCTGLWQISEHKSALPSAHPEYDLFYVAHRSLRLDAWILWRTLARELRIRPLVSLADVPSWACSHATPQDCHEVAGSYVAA